MFFLSIGFIKSFSLFASKSSKSSLRSGFCRRLATRAGEKLIRFSCPVLLSDFTEVSDGARLVNRWLVERSVGNG